MTAKLWFRTDPDGRDLVSEDGDTRGTMHIDLRPGETAFGLPYTLLRAAGAGCLLIEGNGTARLREH